MKESKQIYYTKYFESNWNNIKNTWKGIKTIISINNVITTILHSIEFISRTITDPTVMCNVFNNYFTSMDEETKSNIKLSPKHYTNYLSNTNTNTFFLTRTDKNEILFISLLDSHKSSGPNTCKNFKTPKNDISQQLSDIFNVFFYWAIFFSSKNSQSYTYTLNTIYSWLYKVQTNTSFIKYWRDYWKTHVKETL